MPRGADLFAVPTADTTVTVRVPAKVNLFLGCGLLRDDGFHELTTVFHAVSLFDEVTVWESDGLTVEVTGEGETDVPLDGTNLAVRAARLLGRRLGIEPDVHVALHKGIPVAGGMAGGSADAAGTLVALDALWGAGLTREALEELAAELGSDVPFALHGGTALGVGRGEQLTSVLARGDYHWVFALADGGLPTPAVYAELDAWRAGADPRPVPSPDAVFAALRSGNAKALGAALVNDLQVAAIRLRPGLRRTLEAGRELGALGSVVSGSGPTCAFLVPSAADALSLAASLSAAGVCRAVRTAHGPVHGARIVATEI
ncbi:MAG: 4-diphosphocytidyl-2-C-methyl-D-erythritol kinase [Frankiales bacterium]|jgi:4-diphosphocytidyl-2-C-methyl-D-erythritol kinase|nr:4-diphosphocytidyl-2-C-methyl-D-erythritol kinase [Frankiales bacterium]